ncbi:hypothetical protein [Jiangella gansuensis]|uniref:hypothetical protein n=1 Tax=Jiangella gansuensis TaxID=281473 RepID=UPI0012F7F1B7|nr:hypothetical protein [Jiangella gansuensis]
MTAAAARAAAEAAARQAPCDPASSGHCGEGRHDQCAHRIGGPQEDGVWFPETYLIGPAGLVPNGPVAVVEPSHVWRCSCTCHSDPNSAGWLW